jgi:hypothetical protein
LSSAIPIQCSVDEVFAFIILADSEKKTSIAYIARAGLWARNAGTAEALPNMKAFANFADARCRLRRPTVPKAHL